MSNNSSRYSSTLYISTSMYKTLFLFLTLLFSCNLLISQNFTARIIDKNTNAPIPFAAIQLDKNTGVISNEEGVFTLHLENNTKVNLTISCLGYASKTLSTQDIAKNNFIINLDKAINQLDEVYLSSTIPNAEAIIANANLNLKVNYLTNLIKHNIFYRESAYVDFKSLDFEIEKASHVKKSQLTNANNSLDSLTNVIMNNRLVEFTDFMGDLHVRDKDSAKLTVDKATKLIDASKDFSIESIQKKSQNIILEYLDKTKSYKIKSGLFKIEDSLSLKQVEQEFKNRDSINKYPISYLKDSSQGLLKDSQFYDESFLSKILNRDLYKYTFENVTYYNNELVYIIMFKPRKSKAKFTGKLYISDDTFAILKADYAYAQGRRGSKFNLKLLIGVKYVENLKKGTIIFKKNDKNMYQPYYINEESGSYFYVNRPIKFIENSGHKYKVSFNFIIEGNMRNKKEVLLTKNQDINADSFNTTKEEDEIPYELLKKYDATIWENNEVLEPLEEMKQFSSSE